MAKTVVEIAADPEIEEPVARLDLVLNIQSQLLDVRVTEVAVERAASGEVIGQQPG